MLTQEELTESLHDALKGATPPCGRFCTAGATIEDDRYLVHHNGTGSRDTDAQIVHAPGVLGLSKDGLAAKLRPWIEGLHKGERIDLNAMEVGSSEPAAPVWPWIWRFDPASGISVATITTTGGSTNIGQTPFDITWGGPHGGCTAMTMCPSNLVYAATSRCPCGAGLAYDPKGESGKPIQGYWDCSAILLGEAVPSGQPGSVQHTGQLPFAFYEVKSEGQPSAEGATTRPQKE